MITLSYELLGVMMIAPMILGAVMSYIIYSCEGESKNKTTLDRLNTRLEIEKEANKILNRNIESKDKQIKDLEDNVAREFALRKKMEQKKRTAIDTTNIPYEKKQNPYEGMTNMEIAKQDDRERKLKLKK